MCPDTPDVRQKTTEHVFDAYIDKLPESEFSAFSASTPLLSVPSTGVATRENFRSPSHLPVEHLEEASTDPGEMNSAATHRHPTVGANDTDLESKLPVSEQEPPPTAENLTSYGTVESAVAVPGTAGSEGTAERAAKAVALLPTMLEFKWVDADVGEPFQTVLPKNGCCWSTAQREVRFRLANRWLSCEQVRPIYSFSGSLVFSPNLTSRSCVPRRNMFDSLIFFSKGRKSVLS